MSNATLVAVSQFPFFMSFKRGLIAKIKTMAEYLNMEILNIPDTKLPNVLVYVWLKGRLLSKNT